MRYRLRDAAKVVVRPKGDVRGAVDLLVLQDDARETREGVGANAQLADRARVLCQLDRRLSSSRRYPYQTSRLFLWASRLGCLSLSHVDAVDGHHEA